MRNVPLILVLANLGGCGYPWDVFYDSSDLPGVSLADPGADTGLTGVLANDPATSAAMGESENGTTAGVGTDGSGETSTSGPIPGDTTEPVQTTADDPETGATTGPDADCLPGPALPEVTAALSGLTDIHALELASNGDVLILASTVPAGAPLGGDCGLVTGAFVAAFDRCTLICDRVLELTDWDAAGDMDVVPGFVAVVGSKRGAPVVQSLTDALQPINTSPDGEFTSSLDMLTTVAVGLNFIDVAGTCAGPSIGVARLDLVSLNVIDDLCAINTGLQPSADDIAVRDGVTVLVGTYAGNVQFGEQLPALEPLADAELRDIYMVTLAAEPGMFFWDQATRIGGTNDDSLGGAVIGASRVLVAGQVSGEQVMPPPNEPDCPFCGADAFVGSFSLDLAPDVHQRHGTNLAQFARGIALFGDDPVIAGSFSGLLDESQEPVNGPIGFLARLDAADLSISEFRQFDTHKTVDHIAADEHGVVLAGGGFFLQTLTLAP